MREILFRGKRVDNGRWVEGQYTCEEYEPHVMLEWKQSNTNEHSEDKFRDMWDECLGWV